MRAPASLVTAFERRRDNQIQGLELLSIALGMCTFAGELQGCDLHVYSDNTGAEACLRKGAAKAFDHSCIVHSMWKRAVELDVDLAVFRVPTALDAPPLLSPLVFALTRKRAAIVWAADFLAGNGFVRACELASADTADLEGWTVTAQVNVEVLHELFRAAKLAARRGARRLPHAFASLPRTVAREAPTPSIIDRLAAPVAPPVACGPWAALAETAARLRGPADAARWREVKRARAMLQPCARSLLSVRSGLKCLAAYCVRVLQYPCMQLPPASADLVAWGALFRCGATYANHCGYVRVGCLLAGTCAAVFDSPEVRRARAAVRARGDWISRPLLFIRKWAVASLVGLGARRPEWLRASMLFLLAYTFLLRVPSEALPAVRVDDAGDAPSFQAALVLGAAEHTLLLRRRKNKAQGSRLTRRCWCASCRATCPVHNLGPWLARRAPGCGLSDGISAAAALRTLREMLAALGVQEAGLFRLHDLRRGHASDLQEAGATLAEILAAGEWRSCAFMAYLDRDDLERDAVVEAEPRDRRPRHGALHAPGARLPRAAGVGPGPSQPPRRGQPRTALHPPTAAAGGVEALHARPDLWGVAASGQPKFHSGSFDLAEASRLNAASKPWRYGESRGQPSSKCPRLLGFFEVLPRVGQQGPVPADSRCRRRKVAPPGGQQGRGPRVDRCAHHQEDSEAQVPPLR
ncbi:unnamed protein product [Prorocentrum cordatum]|uniref:Uncharacterized protein n=1 Tax=Prorocentrum cordatum TaxID=2364126 RepID=A0ABN9W3E5_9DINO|nr:unnamed protein product [Polarella glacialis]